jgi:outer membrane immunogenic protein
MRAGSFVAAIAVVAGAAALTPFAASAADVPVRAARPAAVAVVAPFDWTGFYLGLYAGVGVQRSHGEDPTRRTGPGELEFVGEGFTGGATAGYNYQVFPNWVVGLEGDIGYLGLDNAFRSYFPDQRFNSETSWIGTVRGRVGYTSGPSLTYVTGGAAWVHVEDTNDLSVFGGPRLTSTRTAGGYVIGSGIETRLGGNWTAKAEHLYVDVGDGPTLSRALPMQVDKHRYELMKFGVNYLFGDKPQAPLLAYNWTGAYAGLVGGSAVSSTEGSDPSGTVGGNINNNGTGFTLGGIAGFNWHVSPLLVAGVEGDFSWLGIENRSVDYFDGPASLGIDSNWLATARVRVGYSAGSSLIYLTGGGAWVNLQNSFQPTPARAGGPRVSSTETLTGLTIGGGIEAPSFIPGWMSRTEYLFVSAGEGDTLSSRGDRFVADHNFHLFRFALVRNFAAGWN